MTTASIDVAPAVEVTPETMYKVKLKSAISLNGFLFKPGQDITVNAATLKSMGDAVANAEQI